MRTQPTSVPASRPPRTIRFIVFELSRKEHCDQNFVNGALDGDHTDKTENGMRCIPKLQEPLKEQKLIKQTTHKKQPQTYQKLKEAKHANNTKDMSNEHHHGAEFWEHKVEHGTKEERNQEKHQQNRRIAHNGPNGDDSDPDERARGVRAIRIWERLDEHVRDDEEDGHEYREEASEKMTACQLARGTSPDSFSDGWPSFFLLYPVILVRESRQYPIHELLCDRELPRDIHRRNSLKSIEMRI